MSADNTSPPHSKSLPLPTVLRSLAQLNAGLVLMCGNSGDSMLAILENSPHSFTAVGSKSFAQATSQGIVVESRKMAGGIRQAMAQKPAVIAVEEVSEAGAVAAVLDAAEAGFLVFAGVYGSSLQSGIERFLYMSVETVNVRLATALQAATYQGKVYIEDGAEFEVLEFLRTSERARDEIRKNKLDSLPSIFMIR